MKPSHLLGGVLFFAAAVYTLSARSEAHRPVVSPFTFHRDVLPVLARHCGRCHGDDSAVPLLRFEDARLQTWPLRQSLMSGSMPPWFADAGTPVKGPAPMSAEEVHLLMTWAAGGAPEGARSAPAPSPSTSDWALGPPDLILQTPAFTLDAASGPSTHDLTLRHPSLKNRMIRAIDLRPTVATAHRAEVSSTRGSRMETLALWHAGDLPQTLEANAAFRAASNESLQVRMHYRRPSASVTPIADRPEVAIYFAKPGARQVRTIELADKVSTAAAGDRTFSQRVDSAGRLVAVRVVDGPAESWARVTAIAADGGRTPLARVQIRPGWERRYVFVDPPHLARGSRVEVHVSPPLGELWQSLLGGVASSPRAARVSLEVVE
jgi:hypothetical protein